MRQTPTASLPMRMWWHGCNHGDAVGTPQHLIIARIVGPDLLVLAFGHAGMVDELAARITEGEDG
jgi:hypothetical protein